MPWVGKFYMCGEPEHGSNECPKKKQVNLADYEDDGEEEVEIEDLNEIDFVKKQGDSVVCVIQRLLRRSPTLHNDIKSFTENARSRIRYATSSLIIETARTF